MDTEKKNRIFIATFFEGECKSLCRLSEQLSSKEVKGLRIVPLEQIHITWKFIGNITTDETEKVFKAVKENSGIIKNASITFDKLEIWPNLKYPRLISVTSENFDEKFSEYFANLEESLYKYLKIKKEKRRFTPHITIARLKSNVNLEMLDLNFESIKLDIKHTCVVQSITDPKGVLYKILYK